MHHAAILDYQGGGVSIALDEDGLSQYDKLADDYNADMITLDAMKERMDNVIINNGSINNGSIKMLEKCKPEVYITSTGIYKMSGYKSCLSFLMQEILKLFSKPQVQTVAVNVLQVLSI